jgi:hypothetical protein
MERIEVINLNLLNIQEKEIVNHIIEKHYNKISKIRDNFERIIVHLKEFKKSVGKKEQRDPVKRKRKNYEFRLRLVFGKDVFESSNDSWDLGKSLNEAFLKLEKEIQHRLR